MDILNAYNIPWKGLSTGCHHFDFEMGDTFFEAFGDSVIKGGRLDAGVDVNRSASMLLVGTHIRGNVTVECDRCLGDLSLPVDYEGILTVKFSDEIDEYDGDVMWISPSQGVFSIAQYLYESIILSLPYRRVHGTDQNGTMLCDSDMLERFRIVSEDEFNAITAEHNTIGSSSDIASGLQTLKDKLENEK